MAIKKKKTLKKKQKVINIYNDAHLGDAIFVMIYLYNCKNFIIKNNIRVNFYIRKKHIAQVEEFKCCENIHIYDIHLMTPFPVLSDIEMMIRNDNYINSFHSYHFLVKFIMMDLNLFKKDTEKTPYNEFLVDFYSNILSKKTGLPKIEEFSYTDPDLLKRYNNFDNKFKNNDILIINSKPQSLQYDLNANIIKFNKMIRILAEDYKVITTAKIPGILCTLDGGLTLKDIGAISTHAKYIIAINTGPLIPCLNTYALKNVKKWFIFDIRTPFRYKNFYLNKSFDEIINALHK